MRTLLTMLLTACITFMMLRWELFGFLFIRSLPYLVSSLFLIFVIAIACWFFRRQLGDFVAQRTSGRVSDIYDVFVDSDLTTIDKFSAFGREYLRREQMRLMLFFCLGIAGTLVGIVNIYLMFDQNKLMREQTQQLVVQNKDIKTQTQELLAQNKMNREQWEGERRASLLKIIYDMACEGADGELVNGQKNNVVTNGEVSESSDQAKVKCVPESNLRERQEAVRAYSYLQKRSGQRVNLSGANAPGTNLSGSVLALADLSKINFAGANLSNTELVNANLRGSNLSDINLKGANIELADLTGAYQLQIEEGKEPVKLLLNCEAIKQATNWRSAMGVSHCSLLSDR